MATEKNIPSSQEYSQGQISNHQNTWYFATNQLNLMYILAAGLIMPPKGFGKKYYEDSLNIVPGWIPLFAETVPKRVLDMVIKETDTLKPVIVKLDLSSVQGSGRAVSINNKMSDIRLPDELTNIHSTILIPAPLPTAFIECLYFASKVDKKECEQDAKDYANVPLTKFKRNVKKRLFGGSDQLYLSPQEYFRGNNDVTMDKFLAVGGMTAMMLNCGNMGELSVRACQTTFEGTCTDENFDWENTVLQGLGDWISTGTVPTSGNMLNTLFWGVVREMIQTGVDLGSENTYEDAILDFLRQSKETSDEKTQLAISKLINDLSSLSQLGDKSTTELFKSHTREFRRALILFFLRKRCADLITFNHPLLTERDYLAAALLFAAREKWIGLPLPLRDSPGLDEAVSHRMAKMAHRALKTGLDIGPSPPRCLPLREILSIGANGWNRKQHQAALTLSRAMGWDCLSTRVRIGRGEYKFIVDAGGVNIYLPGEPKAVETEINKEKFFSLMTAERFLDKMYESKARKILTN